MKQSVAFTPDTVCARARLKHLSSAVIFAMIVSSFVGCHMGNPYGGYYQGYPQTYQPGVQYQQQPIQTYPSTTQPYVPSGPVLPSGSYQPSGSSPPSTYSNPGGGLQPIPEDSNAPPFNSSDNGQNRNVPDPYFNSTSTQGLTPSGTGIQPANHYQEPGPLHPPTNGLREVQLPAQQSQSTQTAQQGGQNPFGSTADYNPIPVRNSASAQESIPAMPVQDEFAMPIQQTETAIATPPNTTPPSAGSGQADPFAMPSAPAQTESASPLFPAAGDITAHKPVSRDVATFGCHPEYKWLRGVLSQQPQDGAWSIVFMETPDDKDRLDGHVTLAPSPHLDGVTNGDVVEIRGGLDPVATDALGKPVYLISELETLHTAP